MLIDILDISFVVHVG